MLSFISFILFFISFSAVFFWRNSYNTLDPKTEEKKRKKRKRKVLYQKTSILTIAIGYLHLLVFSELNLLNIWDAMSVLIAVWGVVYFVKNMIEKTNPLKGQAVKSKFFNFILTEIAFGAFYFYVWWNLLIFMYQSV